ncbi:MAG: hypothetical protein ACRDJM_07065, partial [Actinomycetota bacterium]
MNKVLGLIAFARAPKRVTKVVLGLMSLAVVGLAASSSFAVPPKPQVVRAEVKDADGDGFVDGIILTFSAPMDNTVASPNGFSVDGFSLLSPPSEWVAPAQGAPTTQLRLKLVPRVTSGGDTDAVPTVRYAAGASAPARTAAPLSEELATSTLATTDTAGPVLMRALAADVAPENVFNKQGDELRFQFSEKVKILGANAGDRAQAIELAMKFSALPGGVCIGDGQDTGNAGRTNFPSPKSANDPNGDPVLEPAPNGSARSLRTVFRSETAQNQSVIHTPAIPGNCGVGVDANGVANITDVVTPPNNAVSQDFGGVARFRRQIEILPRGVQAIATQDLGPGNGDGIIDAIRLSYEYNVLDASVTNALISKYAVKLGAATATVTGVETGTPGDQHLIVRIGDVVWGGGEKPTVTFDGTGCILKAGVPSAGVWACADSFTNIQSIDGVGPAVTTSGTKDLNANGLIDAVEIQVTETVASGATAAGWTVAGQPATSLTGAGTSRITLGFAEDSARGTGARPNVAYDPTTGNTVDLGGAELRAQTFTPLDTAAPRVVKATTLASTGNGKVDRVTFEVSEPVNSGALSAAAFSIDGTPATAFGTSAADPAGAPGDALVTVVVDKAGTGRFGVGVAATLTDAAGNINNDDLTIPAADTIDAAAPVVTSLTTTPASPFAAGTVTVRARFSELLDTAVTPASAIGAKSVSPVSDATHTNGFANDDASVWEGTAGFAGGDCAEQNGCSLSVTLTGAKDP